ncbi:SDR family NAD(P)-dependent oxidoreductase [Roseomonas populi]|uniref:Glucose 1-dehydrogenase n=1 Tax=Roseomonas populi TaxID=3121582 RepID=A0ABT1X121_9PROT|nr:glucose 1-dehydrogenase [Roseomonas pecuniae]MCR0981078.1 glucose 1-dehydrogenase [Roseomonas pecuniae]
MQTDRETDMRGRGTPLFDGEVIVVTGGARGMGAAEARLAVAEGATVVIGDILDEAGEALADELGPRCRYRHLDVSVEADWAAAVEFASSLGQVSGLVNNAAIYVPQPLMDTPVEMFERHLRVNQLGCFLGMRAVVPAMKAGGGGSIVNLSSSAGLRGSPGSFAYSATKWAVRGMTKSAAMDLGPHGIRVNSLHPGPIDTPMIAFRTEEQMRQRLAKVPLGRMGGPEEVAEMVVFLLSRRGAYITGAEIAVDGGVSL